MNKILLKYQMNIKKLIETDPSILVKNHVLSSSKTLNYGKGYDVDKTYRDDDNFYVFREKGTGDMVIFDTLKDIMENPEFTLEELYVMIMGEEPTPSDLEEFAKTMPISANVKSGNQFPGCIQMFYKKSENKMYVKFIQNKPTCKFNSKCSKGLDKIFSKIFRFLEEIEFDGTVVLDDDANIVVGEESLPFVILNVMKDKDNISIYEDYGFEVPVEHIEKILQEVQKIRSKTSGIKVPSKIDEDFIKKIKPLVKGITLNRYLENMENSNYREILRSIERRC